MIVLLVCGGCSNAPVTGDRRLLKDEVPAFMKKYQNASYQQPEFFEKEYQLEIVHFGDKKQN